MLRTRHIMFVLFPAVLIAIGIFSFRFLQYHALFGNEGAQTEVGLDLIPILPHDPVIGSPTAPKTIVAFEDLACAGCKAQDSMLTDLQVKHPGKVKIIWKGLPVVLYPYQSEPAHEYAFCAHRQGKFEPFKDFAFANSNDLSQNTLSTIVSELDMDQDTLATCLASGEPSAYIDNTRTMASLLHVQSVPTFFIDNVQIQTPSSLAEWEAILGL